MERVARFFLPGAVFTWRAKKKTHKGPCPKRGHCTRTFEATLPVGKGNSKRALNGRVVPDPKTAAAGPALAKLLGSHPAKPGAPLSGDVGLDVVYVFSAPERPLWRREACLANWVRPTQRGTYDIDNLTKLLGDALEKAGWVADDARVTCGFKAKIYGAVPGYWLQVSSFDPSPSSAAIWRAMAARSTS